MLTVGITLGTSHLCSYSYTCFCASRSAVIVMIMVCLYGLFISGSNPWARRAKKRPCQSVWWLGIARKTSGLLSRSFKATHAEENSNARLTDKEKLCEDYEKRIQELEACAQHYEELRQKVQEKAARTVPIALEKASEVHLKKNKAKLSNGKTEIQQPVGKSGLSRLLHKKSMSRLYYIISETKWTPDKAPQHQAAESNVLGGTR